jgi:hypothetical protein
MSPPCSRVARRLPIPTRFLIGSTDHRRGPHARSIAVRLGHAQRPRPLEPVAGRRRLRRHGRLRWNRRWNRCGRGRCARPDTGRTEGRRGADRPRLALAHVRTATTSPLHASTEKTLRVVVRRTRKPVRGRHVRRRGRRWRRRRGRRRGSRRARVWRIGHVGARRRRAVGCVPRRGIGLLFLAPRKDEPNGCSGEQCEGKDALLHDGIDGGAESSMHGLFAGWGKS